MLPFEQIALINSARRTARTPGRRAELARAIRAIRQRADRCGIPRRILAKVFATQAPLSPAPNWPISR